MLSAHLMIFSNKIGSKAFKNSWELLCLELTLKITALFAF